MTERKKGPSFSPKRIALTTLLVSAVGLAAVIYLFGLSGGGPRATALSDGYTGSATCKECHEEVYNGWQSTFHPVKFQTAGDDFIIGDFSGRNTLVLEGATFTMSRKEGDFIVTLGGEGGGEEHFRVSWGIGNIWRQKYLTELPNGQLAVLPIQWNVKRSKWEGSGENGLHGVSSGSSSDSSSDSGSGSGGSWRDKEWSFQYRCMGCHTTNSSVGLDSETGVFKTEWSEPGIGCEACHGPGAAHLAADIRDKAGSIVNPARLPDPRRAAMICGSCHTRGSSPDNLYAYPEAFQPGDQLDFIFDEKPGLLPDGSSKEHHQQYNDWKESGHNQAGVACWDCHSPHIRGKSNRFQLKLPGSLLCISCHEVARQGVHGLHSVNNCIGCHMPNSIKSATPGDLRSHKFKVVRPELTVAAENEADQPNSCNLCHYHRDDDPERLVHYLRGIQKPVVCKMCHYHEEEELDE